MPHPLLHHTFYSDLSEERLVWLSGDFTTTVKESLTVSAIDDQPEDISWDGYNTLWIGDQNEALYLQSGLLTSTIKSQLVKSINHMHGISSNAPPEGHTPWTIDAQFKLQSGQFDSVVKASLPTGSNRARGITFDGTDTGWTDKNLQRLMWYVGQFTTTSIVSTDISSIDSDPSGISWDGQDVPWSGLQANKLYLQSGKTTTTLKHSLSRTEPTGIETGSFAARLGLPPAQSVIGLNIIGSTVAEGIGYVQGVTFDPIIGSLHNHHRIRTNIDIDTIFNKGFFNFSESGVNLLSSTVPATGVITPVIDDATWNSYYIDGILSGSDVDDYRYAYSTASSGYIDFKKDIQFSQGSLSDNFGVYLNISRLTAGGSGIIFWRGQEAASNKTEFQLRFQQPNSLVLDYTNALGTLFSKTFVRNNENNEAFVVLMYNGGSTSGEFVLGEAGTAQSSWARTGYFSPPRRVIPNLSTTRLFKTGDNASTYANFDGWIHEFGISASGITFGTLVEQYEQSMIEPYSYLRYEDNDTTYSEFIVPDYNYSTNPVDSYTGLRMDYLGSNVLYQFLGPIQLVNWSGGLTNVAPSSMYVDVTYESSVVGSGTKLNPKVNLISGGNVFRIWEKGNEEILPSGIKQTKRLYTDSLELLNTFNEYPTLYEDVNSVYYDINFEHVPSGDLSGGSFKLYSIEFMADMFAVFQHESGVIPLHTFGWYANEDNNIPLYIEQSTAFDNIPLYIKGFHIPNDNIPLFTMANTKRGIIPLFTEGHLPINSGISLFTDTVKPSKTITLHTRTATPIPASSDISLFVWGADVPSVRNQISLHTDTGNVDPEHSLNLYLEAELVATTSGTMPLFITRNVSVSDSGISLYVSGPPGENKSVPLFVKGLGSDDSEDFVPINANMPLFIGDPNLFFITQTNTLYVHVYDEGTGTIPMYVDGVFIANSSVPLHIKGLGHPASSSTLYTHGF